MMGTSTPPTRYTDTHSLTHRQHDLCQVLHPACQLPPLIWPQCWVGEQVGDTGGGESGCFPGHCTRLYIITATAVTCSVQRHSQHTRTLISNILRNGQHRCTYCNVHYRDVFCHGVHYLSSVCCTCSPHITYDMFTHPHPGAFLQLQLHDNASRPLSL